jgi:tetratricopeptide (TPR) repeat protein
VGTLVSTATFDVFISYGHQDQAWVLSLAENLHRAGLDVFLDAWEITPGDVVVHQLERGLLTSRNGVLVISPASVARPWVQQEYAVMVSRAVEGSQRLIPVLLGDVEIPPFAATRLWVDFRGADGPEYERRVRLLVAALRGERPQRPARDSELAVPPRSGLRPEGARRTTLRISRDETVLEVEGKQAAGRAVGPTQRLEEQLWQVERARRRGPHAADLAVRASGEAAGAGMTMHGRLVEAGTSLAAAFLPDGVRAGLVEQVRLATDQGAALRLAVEVTAPTWVDLPWEALVLPELTARPLVLHPRVELYRSVAELGATTAIQIRGPLRILVVIGSPDQGDHGELLDYEAELRRILDAVEPARREQRAYIRILNRGTVAEMRAALHAQRFHILHISCHARPGALYLENEDGQPDEVTAERLASEVLVADRGVPLVVLAGCSTALTERVPKQSNEASRGQGDDLQQGEAALPGLARQLLSYGLPTVLAMNAPVTDPYAARLSARLYQELATQQRPDPLAAVAEARRQVDAELRRAPAGSREALLAELAEWATPVLAVRGPSLPLFDPAEGYEKLQAPPEPRLAPGIVVRGVGDFVGRRREERLLLAALRGQRAGVVIHGIGGVGKSTLAAQLVADLGEQAGLVVSVAGKVTVDQVLDEIGRRLLSAALVQGWDETHLLRQLARLLREPKTDWTDRLDLLAEHLLHQAPVLLLLDNFEDNLQPTNHADPAFELTDPQLAEFFSAWIHARGMSQLLVTSRYPFPLPDNANKRLETHHLGPLSLAETRKLVWRLPALDKLDPDQLQRAYADVGGHPRALEYLDALIQGGEARFDDVSDRLEQALADRQIDDPTAWLAEVRGNLDRALAETVTLAVNDVLLTDLLDRLDRVPLARRLLLGISVYRLPVDEHGVAWQVAEEITQPADPQRQERLRQLADAVWAAQDTGQQVTAERLGLPQAEFAELARELREGPRPPLAAPAGLSDTLGTLAELGLVAPADPSDPTEGPALPLWVVHRWTAAALARLAANPDLMEAHQRAARYWRWRFQEWPQDRQADIVGLLEARYHHEAAGDLDKAVEVTEHVCSELRTWGAWSWDEQLCRETLEIVPNRSRSAAAFTHELGIIAQQRGNYDQALDWYRQALAIKEELGDRAGMASSYGQLGIIAQQRGDYEKALGYYRQALPMFEELGDRAGMATSYHQLGIIAYLRDDYEKALDWYRQALAIREELGDRPGMASSYHQLGMLVEQQGDYEKALDWYRQALAIREELGDRPGIAGSYHQLGNVAYLRGDYEKALDWYRQAVAIFEELGDRADMATSYHQLGMVAQRRRDYDQALGYYRSALAIFEELGNHADMADTISQVGALLTETGNPKDGLSWTLRSLGIRAELRLPEMSTDLRWLQRQRVLLGSRRFQRLLRQKLGDKDSQMVIEWLQQLPDN